jgi:hypothetical protein
MIPGGKLFEEGGAARSKRMRGDVYASASWGAACLRQAGNQRGYPVLLKSRLRGEL